MMLTIVDSALLDLLLVPDAVAAVAEAVPDDVRVTPCIMIHQQLSPIKE